MKDLYTLELGESIDFGGGDEPWVVWRVPGGWIFKYYLNPPTSVFVPFDNEFQTH